MILERSTGYWSTGIILTWQPDGARAGNGERVPGWMGTVSYLDDGWLGDDDADAGKVCTQGQLTTRYPIADGTARTGLAAVVDALMTDAARLGIEFTNPHLLVPGDGEWADTKLPDGWRELLADEAQRIGWNSYTVKPAEPEVPPPGDPYTQHSARFRGGRINHRVKDAEDYALMEAACGKSGYQATGYPSRPPRPCIGCYPGAKTKPTT